MSFSQISVEIAGKIWQKLSPYWRMKIIRATQKKFTVSVGAVIVNENKEILLLEHVLRPASGWGIPGGFVEHGEQPEEAIRREILEETGLGLENVEMYRVRTINRHVEILFSAKGKGTAEVKSREIKSLGWFRIEEMPAEMSKVQKTIIRQVLGVEV